MIYFIKNLKDTFRYNLFRSILTGLGVFIGIASGVIILTISNSFSASLLNEYVNKTTIGLISSADSLVDMENIMTNNNVKFSVEKVRNLPSVKDFSETYVEKTVGVLDENTKTFKDSVVIEFKDVTVIEGVSFSERFGNVAIARNNEEFETNYAVGDWIFINNESYEIIGVTDDTGDTNPSLYFPRKLKSKIVVDSTSISSSFNLEINDGYNINIVRNEVLEIMNSELDSTAKFIDYSEETNKAVKESIGTISIFLVLISTISLVVASINVVNIMYISTLEKLNEVAIYRALGMSKKNVIGLFVMESLLLVSVFAILGYIFGLLIAAIILVILDIPISFSVLHVLLVLLISIVLGIGSGIKPAIKAANSSPASLLK